MSGSLESHRLDLDLYSHPKEFWRNGVRTHVNSKRKIPPEEVRTRAAALSRTVSPTHFQRAIPAPKNINQKWNKDNRM